METHGAILFGAFGTDPFAAIPYLEGKGYTTDVAITKSGMQNLLNNSDGVLFTYIINDLDKPSTGMHTVTIQPSATGGFDVYNEYSKNSNITNYSSLDDFLNVRNSINIYQVPLVMIGVDK